MPELLHQKLDVARRDLLDLGLRNTLLNYRPLRTRGAELTGAAPAEVFRLLVTEGRSFALRPGEPPDVRESQGLEPLAEGVTPGLTPYSPTQLQPRLLHTYYTARTFLEEQGVNVLYVALGLLEWSETEPAGTVRRAPLILVPVEISRSDVHSRFRLRHTGEEIGENLSLRMKLQQDFGIELPELPELTDEEVAAEGVDAVEAVENYFRAVGAAISGRPGWRVDDAAAVLGFFSFSKLLMYRDLDPDSWPEEAQPASHPILQALLTDSFHEPPPVAGEEDNLDRRVDAGSLHPVVDADSSQTLVILDVLHGRNLVVQGPPGTGKSQTITNLIAEAVAADRTVLFVAEKLAALEVVKRNLDKTGLGVFALELHSRKTNKREVLQELRHTLSLGSPILPQAADADLATWQSTRDRLNAYCDAVNDEIGTSGVRPHDAFGRRLRLVARLDPLAPPPLRDDQAGGMAEWSADDFRRRAALTADLQGLIATIGPLREHPFFGSRVMAFRTDVAPLARAASAALAEACEAASRLADVLGLAAPSDLAAARRLERAGQTVAEEPDLRGLQPADAGWARADLPELLGAGAALARLHAEHDPVLLESAWDEDVLEARTALAHFGPKWWRFFSAAYRSARRHINCLYFNPPPEEWTLLLRTADALLEAQRLAQKLRENDRFLGNLFRDRWLGWRSNWKDLDRVAGFLARVHAERAGNRLPAEILALLGWPADAAVPVATRELGAALSRSGQATAALFAALDLDEDKRWGPPPDLTPDPSPIAHPPTGRGAPPPSPRQRSSVFSSWGEFPPLPGEGCAMGEGGQGGEVGRGAFSALPFAGQDATFHTWAGRAPLLQDMVAVNHLTRRMAEDALAPVVSAAEEWPAADRALVDLLESAWLAALLHRAERERPELARFHRGQHMQAVTAFRTLDVQTLLVNRARVALQHWERLPREGAAGQTGTLRREFEKKRRHLPIRQLMSQAGNAVQAVKPVFLMSPLSVAAYLPPGSVQFDLVIFDEASQVRPVDALGALLRGGQAVVVGDSQQLPPTTFFDKLTDPGSDEEDDDATADLESVLGLFRARGAPERTLSWHYRSRHESLIAVSNRLFYENRLVVFPSPDLGREARGLVFHHLPDAYYEPGTGRRRNPGEAQAVARAVLEHARTRPELSLGVAAFNLPQTRAILDEVELLRRQDPSCEPFFAARSRATHPEEPFFVKNLENVQGDERDVIFISVGYGRTADGTLSHNFGPLNQEGGQRRLNVLISRAKQRCEVFANFTGEDLDPARTPAAGVAALKIYLEAAARHGTAAAMGAAPPVETPFADRVAEALRGRGWDVRERIGVAGCFLDLAVVDPEQPGRYLLGIECDGPSYRSARSARDRERLRPDVLARLGWRLHRIWSPGWFRDPDGELRRVIEILEQAKEPSPPDPLSHTHSHPPGRGGASPGQTPFDIAREEAIFTGESPVRDRNRLPAGQRKTERVSRQEIRAAVRQAVESSAGIAGEELTVEAGRLLGWTRVTRKRRAPIEAVIREMVDAGELREQGEFLLLE